MGKQRTAGEAAKWVTGELFGRLNKAGVPIEQSPISPEQMAGLLRLRFDGVITVSAAKHVLDVMWDEGGNAPEIVKRLGLEQVVDSGEIEAAVAQVISANSAKVEDAKTNPNTIGWFVGQVMKSSKGKANPQKATDLLRTKIFEDWTRTRLEPLQPGERLFDLYDQNAGHSYGELRSLLNLWISEIDEPGQKDALISRIQLGENAAFRAALIELIVHDLFVRLGHRVAVEPLVSNSTRRPDFALLDSKGTPTCFVEVTTVNRAQRLEKEINREGVIYSAIDDVKLPRGYLLGYHLVRAGLDSPALGPLVDSIQRWAQSNLDRVKTDQIVERFSAEDWIIELELFSAESAASATGSIAIASMGGGVIGPHKDLRAALYRKSRGYGDMNAPYVIVVADAKDQMFGKQQVRQAITEAVFGDEHVVFAEGKVGLDFAMNGFWRGPSGPRNTHVTGVLFFPQTSIWKLRDPKWEPILAVNPWANSQLPSSMKSLMRLEADGGKWVEKAGKPIGDLLGLPVPWPPES